MTCLPAWLVLALLALPQENPQEPASTQPATAPSRTFRHPRQEEILRALRTQMNTVRPPIAPEDPDEPQRRGRAGTEPPGRKLLLEGTILYERPGRLLISPRGPEMQLLSDESGRSLPPMPLNRNQLLEIMEREAMTGGAEFVITARVERYRGENWLTVLKAVKRVGHGNLAP